MQRFTNFLLSNSNLAGCAASALVVSLFLTGMIHNYWLVLSALAYGGGYFSMIRPAPTRLVEGASTADSLAWLRVTALPKLPAEAARVLTDIIEVTDELMPRLKEMESQGMVQAQNRTLLKQTITRFLPDALEGYLKLPALYARNTKVDGDKTPNQVLVDQLNLLSTHVHEIRDGILSEQVNSLLTNGRFLQDKFNQAFKITQ
jgi:hypothetical protein